MDVEFLPINTVLASYSISAAAKMAKQEEKQQKAEEKRRRPALSLNWKKEPDTKNQVAGK